MTGFANEPLIYKGLEFEVVAPSTGDGPFLPERYGLSPYPAHTACSKGYRCVYRVNSRGLLLDTLWINHGAREGRYGGRPSGDMPTLGGVAPDLDYGQDGYQEFRGKYANLQLLLDYDGAIVIARSEPAPERPMMGRLQAWDFGCVWKLTFRAGRLVKEQDISSHMEILRTRYGIDGEFYNYTAGYSASRLRNARRYLVRHLGRDLRIA